MRSCVCDVVRLAYADNAVLRLHDEERHRTTVNLPVTLLREAEDEIGSTSATETIIAALRDMVARRRRARLLDAELPDLTPAAVEQLRQPRSLEF